MPLAVHQPVLCMQCENAPCESVCPVAATTHSQEGLNMMTYNRCVGTRYCSNNCPTRCGGSISSTTTAARSPTITCRTSSASRSRELIEMQKNPDVTVRMRGVMEKCTYCIQRIEQARIAARREGDRADPRRRDPDRLPADLPGRAIVFGDLNDPTAACRSCTPCRGPTACSIPS